jgi:hypothetical protein
VQDVMSITAFMAFDKVRHCDAAICPRAFQFLPNSGERRLPTKAHWGCVMTVKNIVIELEVEYLQKSARERGVSRAKLVRLLMKKVIADELVSDILGDGCLRNAEPSPKRYRRFLARKSTPVQL